MPSSAAGHLTNEQCASPPSPTTAATGSGVDEHERHHARASSPGDHGAVAVSGVRSIVATHASNHPLSSSGPVKR